MNGLNERDKQLSKAMGLHGRYPPFIEFMGIQFEPLDDGGISIKLAMRDDLSRSGNSPVLHGGVISAMMDVIGGSIVAWKLKDDIKDLPLEEQAKKLSRVNTIDMRIDYLRPGKGKVFTATGSILRKGKNLAVTRMELHNEEQVLIAVGTGTFTAA